MIDIQGTNLVDIQLIKVIDTLYNDYITNYDNINQVESESFLDNKIRNCCHINPNPYLYRLISLVSTEANLGNRFDNQNIFDSIPSMDYLVTMIETFKGSAYVLRLLNHIPGFKLKFGASLIKRENDSLGDKETWYGFVNKKLKVNIFIEELTIESSLDYLVETTTQTIRSLLLVDEVAVSIGKLTLQVNATYKSIISNPTVEISSRHELNEVL